MGKHTLPHANTNTIEGVKEGLGEKLQQQKKGGEGEGKGKECVCDMIPQTLIILY